ncbi:hypothetical protein OKA04_23110 [Luteolibacter flavescens]|uniref:Carotenoid biosynthesis protein n=1 Tax=Luteolibacter flavescens TaxID=1859460 RepID=A0ABT3FWM3_9BACT|nr:hypothetical protein [Luteolibacter flavescens]MCW1887646.1 hypothetical protein [Luteolibacter flavescens]
MSEPTGMTREAPWRAGLRAVRANVLPGLLVQGAMVTLLVLYYFHPPARGFFLRLAETKAAWGFGYSILAAAIAGAVVPELLRIVINQRGRLQAKNFRELLFTIPFWGGMGFVVDVFYRGQALWFGDEPIASVVIPQVLVDQFLYNPLFAAPVTVWLFAWKNRGYRMSREFFTASYYRDHVVPALLATWGVWIPVVTVLYLLPEPVQIPLFSLALSLWAILYAWMSEDQARRVGGE